MKILIAVLAVVISMSVMAGCGPEERRYHHRGSERRERDDAWDVVRRDPCRKREYEDYARDHQNPDKRRHFAEQLARDGCSRKYRGEYRYDDPNYDPYR